jgi:hypothetical protein
MAAVLKEGQTLSRLVKVYGIERPVVVTIGRDGLTMKVKGSKTPVMASWAEVVGSACGTPDNVPSKLHGRAMEFLQDCDRRLTASLIKRLDKEAKEKAQ